MLKNYTSKNSNVEFIDYTGEYPNLCSGILTLRIDGIEYTFGSHLSNQETNYPDRFWETGGSCGFMGKYDDEYIEENEWIIDYNLIPDPFKKYAGLIDRVFNENVEYGCCGGCL